MERKIIWCKRCGRHKAVTQAKDGCFIFTPIAKMYLKKGSKLHIAFVEFVTDTDIFSLQH